MGPKPFFDSLLTKRGQISRIVLFGIVYLVAFFKHALVLAELLNRACVLRIPFIMDVFTLPDYSIEEYPKRRKIWQRQLEL